VRRTGAVLDAEFEAMDRVPGVFPSIFDDLCGFEGRWSAVGKRGDVGRSVRTGVRSLQLLRWTICLRALLFLYFFS
jgi:hypothetical protein